MSMTEFKVGSFNIRLTPKSINSKRIYDTITDEVFGLLDMYRNIDDIHSYDRTLTLMYITSLMEELKNGSHITQWDVIWDNRNNSYNDLMNGKQQLVIKFTQANCVNTSQLIYDIEHEHKKEKDRDD